MRKYFFLYLTLLCINLNIQAMESSSTTSSATTPCFKELSPCPTSLTLPKAFGGKIEGEIKEFIDINEKDPIKRQSFKELIEDQQKIGLPFILAVITENGNRRYYDAHFLNSWLFTLLPFNQFSRILGKNDLVTQQPIDAPIRYYEIKSLDDKKFSYLCSENDLRDGPTAHFWRTYFKANQDEIDAQYDLGLLYIKQNKLDEAEKYLKLAADKNFTKAQYGLGCLYEKQGKLALAEKYYLLVANKNSTIAQNALGLLYIKQNKLDEAEKYLKLAADKKYPSAQNSLGYFYECRKDFNNAIIWYKKAAEKLDIFAMLNLIYLFGDEHKEIFREEIIDYCSKISPEAMATKLYIENCPDRWKTIKEKMDTINNQLSGTKRKRDNQKE